MTVTSLTSHTNKCNTPPSHRPATEGPWTGRSHSCGSSALLEARQEDSKTTVVTWTLVEFISIFMLPKLICYFFFTLTFTLMLVHFAFFKIKVVNLGPER